MRFYLTGRVTVEEPRGVVALRALVSKLRGSLAAASVARRMLAIAPLREASYRRLMHIHLAAGDRAQAVAVYARCRQVLDAELGVEGSPDTGSVYLDAPRAG